MRSVVLSIAVHVVLGTVILTKLRARVPEPVAAVQEPSPIEVEIYVAPAVPAVPAVVERPHAGAGIPASHAPSAARTAGGRAIAITSAPARESAPGPVAVLAAPHVAALPSPQDAAAAVSLAPVATVESTPAPANNTFRMRVDGDGTAHLTDRGNLQWGRGGSRAHIAEHAAERWLDEHHEQSNAVDMKVPEVGIPVATFDATDAAMRLAGQDPYAHEKLKVLDATRDERARIGARHRERQLVATPALVRASLAELAHLTADQRAAAIRALYLECDDSPAGEVARATIADYVRERGLAIEFPSSSAHR